MLILQTWKQYSPLRSTENFGCSSFPNTFWIRVSSLYISADLQTNGDDPAENEFCLKNYQLQ